MIKSRLIETRRIDLSNPTLNTFTTVIPDFTGGRVELDDLCFGKFREVAVVKIDSNLLAVHRIPGVLVSTCEIVDDIVELKHPVRRRRTVPHHSATERVAEYGKY